MSRPGPAGPAGSDGAAGAPGAAGANGYSSIAGFTQPAVGATVTSVDYSGLNPGVGSFLDLVVDGAVAGRYEVRVASPTRLDLKLLDEGSVASGNAVGASTGLHGGAPGDATLYAAAVAADWNNDPPVTLAEALDRIAASIGPIP